MPKVTRRGFVKGALAAGAAMTLPSMEVLGANERVNLGFIGVGGRGRHSANWFNGVDGVRVAALCDADMKHVERAAKKFPKAKKMQDMRHMMDDDDIDAVVISTCNHWHVLAGIWAAQAGKDIYVEKPLSWNVWEGRQLVDAVRKYNVIAQGGTQQRSDPLQKRIKDFLDSGKLGKIKYVRCNRYGLRGSIGKREEPLTPPDSCDYNLWLGPAKDKPIYRDRFHYQWHWVWNTGNGECGNWGPHLLDDARNVVYRDKKTMPLRVVSGGGRLGWDDVGDSPNTHFAYYDTGDVPLILDVHNLPMKKGTRAGDVWEKYRTKAFLCIMCENGYYAGGRGGGGAYDYDGKKIKNFPGDGGGSHAQNFIDAVRARDSSILNAPVEETHYSTAWCHMANNSYMLGSDFTPEEAKEAVESYKPWQEVVEGFYEHLDANEIDPDKADIKLGPMLEVDPQTEQLRGPTATAKARSLMDGSWRGYRDGFEVPEDA